MAKKKKTRQGVSTHKEKKKHVGEVGDNCFSHGEWAGGGGPIGGFKGNSPGWESLDSAGFSQPGDFVFGRPPGPGSGKNKNKKRAKGAFLFFFFLNSGQKYGASREGGEKGFFTYLLARGALVFWAEAKNKKTAWAPGGGVFTRLFSSLFFCFFNPRPPFRCLRAGFWRGS